MREYELVYIIQPDAAPERVEEIHKRIDDVIANGGGTFLTRDDWGKRKLAYEIRKFQKGHYVQVNFLGGGSMVTEIERWLRLDADVLRFLTILHSEEVRDVEARMIEARQHAAEQARRREERARLEAEREAERARMAADRDSDDDGNGDRDTDRDEEEED